METVIGIAVLNYNEDGTMSSARFVPSAKVVHASELTESLMSVKGHTDKEIKAMAEIVMATWFSKMSEIELSDRETSTIESEIVNCTNWDNGQAKQCEIRFVFKRKELSEHLQR